MALTRKQMPSPNKSGRGGAAVRLIVLHTAEGATTIEALGSFFSSPSAGVSSHVGIDDKAGMVGEYVPRGEKAWTAASFNPVAVQAELCGFAKWTEAEWNGHPAMLANAGAWIAEEAKAFGIPLNRLTAAQAQGSGRGVCQHVDLGAGGGGHWDCGGGFPLDHVLDLARGGSGSKPSTWYFLQDTVLVRQLGQHAYYGGWSTADARDKQLAKLEGTLGHGLRAFRDEAFPSPYFIDNSHAIAEVYGGWSSKSSRDSARLTLEDRLGYELRPFSEERTKAQGGSPWACKNLA